MRKAFRSLAAAGLAGLLASAPALAQEDAGATVSVETATGERSVPHAPKTVVAFDLATLDTLDALGVDVAGAPTAPYPGYLSKYAEDDVTKVGSLFEADLEAVAALRPDLIITGGRSSSQTKALSQVATTIDMSVDQTDFLVSALVRARALGRIFDRQDEVEARIARLESTIATLKTETEGRGKGLIVLTTGNRMSAFGPGSRFGILHGAFGVAPADSNLDVANHGEAISFEYIAKTDPDWLFVIDRDAAIGRSAAASMLKNELVENTKAWKSGQVVYLDPATWYLSSAGLTALQRNVDQLSEAFAKAE
ncbi:siderophore ABC transporter substrate-binding protein [Aurantimonas sp. VKM B-3413]|uniref:siderophore ABC transporter substrate-binding protein n=1 Tax=Aurantimonas sp. VKM B-3413 TaxID=2779401 RepID=UPI00351D31B8